MNTRSNNFDTLRFLAAMGVLWSHTLVLVGRATEQPLKAVSQAQTDLGALGVTVFFVISGFLITQSFTRSRSHWRFVKARVLRIVPALWVVLALLAFVVGPLVTELSLGEYFASSELYRFVVVNASLLDFEGHLPGVFDSNASFLANASLWSLPVEVRCYILVFAIGILGLLNRHVALALFLCGLVYLMFHREWFDRPHPAVDLDATIDRATTFLAGAVIYLWRPKLNVFLAAGCAAVTWLSFELGGYWIAEHTVVAYLVLYLAFAPLRVPNLARYGDLSYGIYIYAWPVSQLFVLYLGITSWYVLGALAAPITLLLAFLSWHLVEKSSLALKDRWLPGERTFAARFERVTSVLSRWRTRWADPVAAEPTVRNPRLR